MGVLSGVRSAGIWSHTPHPSLTRWRGSFLHHHSVLMCTRLKFHEFVNGHSAPTRDVTVGSIFFVRATGVPFVKGRLTPRFRRIPNTEKEGQSPNPQWKPSPKPEHGWFQCAAYLIVTLAPVDVLRSSCDDFRKNSRKEPMTCVGLFRVNTRAHDAERC